MYSLKLLLISAGLLFFTILKNSDAQWVPVNNGMLSPSTFSLVSGNNKIYAGDEYGGVYLSTNNGENWIEIGLEFQGGISSLAVYGNIIFAGLISNGVYKTTNDGLNWIHTSLNQGNLGEFYINGNNLFAVCWGLGAGPTGVFLSADSGDTWTSIGLSGKRIHSVTGTGNYIFAGSMDNFDGAFKSTDNGGSWTQTLSNVAVWTLKTDGSKIYAGTTTNYNGLYISTNNGGNWTQSSLNNVNVLSLAFIGNNIFAGTGNDNGVFMSTDNGVSFMPRNEGFGSNRIVRALCISNNYIFAGIRYSGVYRRPLSDLITGIEHESNAIPKYFKLFQSFPNPFNPSATIKFSLPKASYVKLTVYDITGRTVQTLVNGRLEAGTHSVSFDGRKLSGGVYVYKLAAENFSDVKRMVLIK
jgi:hypothetical protein